ncbi:transcriptional Coactivator p15-domain-containing protein [Yarrowia lipolytica]|jgi:hypothetical protein|uniref:YALI0E28897p n=2 Tax=Yarrowia lipolytica TaxID=4952 RepID=Q6C485_YARLI|nr:YALI0E28897p [Yarrowia lipolytica CLIB122]AOW06107.1 hypothetical protein YALI1_E34205g [Yarrowia lipolytica]KAB8285619.1 transcriptional Coactivator p15-domain-containing protein [Yarrowia lipolytica]KAE8175293.1 transcriptional Coactivator p15-domain-containing protein [Yarrowia lipolytica]KAJ8057503.1 transcriptional Coactivator p15-domain-containing protein [Yarrowia lipolytica]QNP99261.1 RNA polymerase II transcriptional coactivator KELP [Yarrowia lipolytica]|eukprot:XP_504527.1 YALI0E28897p [Yarrowia lipolytica CLIB122]
MAEDKVFELGNDKRVTVREFKGRTLIDIRAFYEKDGKKLPGSKGISLTEAQFEELSEQVQSIQDAVLAMKAEKEGDKAKAKESKAAEHAEKRVNDKKRKANDDATKDKHESKDAETKKSRGKRILSEEFIVDEDDF